MIPARLEVLFHYAKDLFGNRQLKWHGCLGCGYFNRQFKLPIWYRTYFCLHYLLQEAC